MATKKLTSKSKTASADPHELMGCAMRASDCPHRALISKQIGLP